MTGKELHTDSLERQYGPVHIDLVMHDDRVRIVNISDARGICRTHAITWLSPIDYEVETCFSVAAAEIRSGQSLGKTFRARGFQIDKRYICSGRINIPDWLKAIFNDQRLDGGFRIYEFIAVGEDDLKNSYGIVCEIDTPDFVGKGIDNSEISGTREEVVYYLHKLDEYLNK